MRAIAFIVMMAAGVQAWPDQKDDEPTLLEQLMVTPRKDVYSDADSRRHMIERNLPGADAPLPDTGWDAFLDSIANADINQATASQRTMIEKLSDPDPNRLPR
ncbi:MAG TPA: hypothetical protein VFB36_12625 [Nevskiaceae bacterium]|nr:hypothetical protein [Nevskiaceae bacterium]